LIWGEYMSKTAAIHAAIWAQLSVDGKPLPSTGQEVMGSDYKYDERQMRSFLLNIHTRLASDTPSLSFNWASLDVHICLSDTVITLCGYISSETK